MYGIGEAHCGWSAITTSHGVSVTRSSSSSHLPVHEEKGSLSPAELVPGHLAFNNSFVDFNIGATWQEEVP